MGGRRPIVLVVDDDDSLRLLCRVNLELDGFSVAEAARLDEARRALADQEVDLVLLDIHVGVDDGRVFLEELKRERPELPVVLFTGSAELDAEVREVADAIVPKPFTLEELVGTIRALTG